MMVSNSMKEYELASEEENRRMRQIELLQQIDSKDMKSNSIEAFDREK